jgi:hypothetical protein
LIKLFGFFADRRLAKTEPIEIKNKQAVMALLSGQCFAGTDGQYSTGANRQAHLGVISLLLLS